ncbi:hypothetical protein GCM10011507_04930 [Edaphobacter acidisoli]|uniref:Cytochrome oxidase subunit II copper A binding domain-containing protein n=1 Tax=Edaphobacter acidisoli TaxID=2040573 RepID=A0A916VZY5_9BACT|nr:cupredoxin domain-containing protein [Edaphobacter acidisoli]GGA56618.1 hypothetical protein GCM10011507_04930 [Edaphobacter acidisoli]
MRPKFALLAVIAVALIFSSILPLSACAQDQPQRVEVVAKRFQFIPADITLKKGVPVVLVLTSQDVGHGLKFKELSIDIKAKKGKSAEVTFTPQQTGTFIGQCSVFCGSGHGSMKLTLHVTE